MQQKHIIPIAKSTKPMFGSGMERAMPYLMSSDFVFRAKQSGVIEMIDEESHMAILKYDDGTKDVIDVSRQMAKNSNGGFYISNTKNLLKGVGDRFKANEILAKNDDYFLGDKAESTVYSTGRLAKVAISSGDFTYEDSSIVVEKLAKDLASKITMKKTLNLGVNANIEKIVKVGDRVKTGDALVIFEESFEDQSLNDMLASLGADFSEFITENAKNKLKSKYTGEIVDVVLYYNRDIEEFQPSVQKLIKDYIRRGKAKRKKAIDAVGKSEAMKLDMPAVDKQPPGKIKGEDVDGIFIEIYIEYYDIAGIGDCENSCPIQKCI